MQPPAPASSSALTPYAGVGENATAIATAKRGAIHKTRFVIITFLPVRRRTGHGERRYRNPLQLRRVAPDGLTPKMHSRRQREQRSKHTGRREARAHV